MGDRAASAGDRVPTLVAAAGVILLLGGVVVAIVVRIAATVAVADGPMPVLSTSAYSGFSFAPAKPFVNPYALSDAVAPLAFGVAALGLLVLVVGVALHATARRSR